jgi:hypothetical protein
MMPRKRKTSLHLFENEAAKKGRPTKGYTVKDAVRMVSVSFQEAVPKMYHFDGDVDDSSIYCIDKKSYGVLQSTNFLYC